MIVIKSGLLFKDIEDVNKYYSPYITFGENFEIEKECSFLTKINSFIMKNKKRPTHDEIVKIFYGPNARFTPGSPDGKISSHDGITPFSYFNSIVL